jgi:hypothetical protein
MITVQLIGDRELVAKLEAMPGRVRDGIARAVARLGFELQHKVQAEKLSGQVLKVGTDRFLGSNLAYGKIQECGVARSWVIEAKNAKALRFRVGGKAIFGHRVTHPPLPERSFLRSSLTDMAPTIEEGLRAALVESLSRT